MPIKLFLNNNMNYIEIAKFTNFVLKSHLKKRVEELNEKHNPLEFMRTLRDYDIRPTLIEMQRNFTKNWSNERIVDQLEKDYKKYLEKIDDLFDSYTVNEKSILSRNYVRLLKNLKNPTFLESDLVDYLTQGDNLLDKMDELEQEINLPWFKVGLLFASGEIKNYSLKTMSASEIAKANNVPGGEKYILGTVNSYKTDKDIYYSEKKMRLLFEYCKTNNLPIDNEFSDKLKALEI